MKQLRRAVRKERDKVVSKYVSDNWDTVIVSAVKTIRRFSFKMRFTIAMAILFKPDKSKLEKPA